jgi:hypothetical protein
MAALFAEEPYPIQYILFSSKANHIANRWPPAPTIRKPVHTILETINHSANRYPFSRPRRCRRYVYAEAHATSIPSAP